MNNVIHSDQDLLTFDASTFLPGVSVDCIIIGFHEGNLKVLLNKFDYNDKWMLPGGFVYKTENVDDSAYRTLKSRTGLDNIFLRQFHLFGDCDRTKYDENLKMLEKNELTSPNDHWFLQRFISVGYYALVEYSQVNVSVDSANDSIQWFHLNDVPELYSDHNKILDYALKTIRQQIDYIPFGFELLPEKFALSELRTIYETLLGKKLDRRNFQRKIMSLNLVNKLEETRKKWGSRSTTLYSFNKERYKEALEEGIALVNW